MDPTKKHYCRNVLFTPGTHRIMVTCNVCGMEFYVRMSRIRKNNICSIECKALSYIDRVCLICGKEFKVHKSEIEKGWGKYCSNKCRSISYGKLYSGKNNPNYREGGSFEPYCELFGENLKKRIRAFWNHTCVLCGVKSSKIGESVAVHHVYNNKQTCCDNTLPRFVTLCRSCHSTVTNKHRYNKGQYYEDLFNNIIDNEKHGKSYYTHEEYYEYLKNHVGNSNE